MTLEAVVASSLVARTPTPARSKRARADHDTDSTCVQSDILVKSIAMLDARLRTIESFTEEVFLLPTDSPLAKDLVVCMDGWKARKPATGAHPDGAARLTVAACLLNHLSKQCCNNNAFMNQHEGLKQFCSAVGKIDDLDSHVCMCMAKSTKKGDQVLLKFTWAKVSELNDSARWQCALLSNLGAIRKTGPAPKGPIIRQLE